LEFRAEFIRRLPQGNILRGTKFFKELSETARDVESDIIAAALARSGKH
jgi:hypothetical protein